MVDTTVDHGEVTLEVAVSAAEAISLVDYGEILIHPDHEQIDPITVWYPATNPCETDSIVVTKDSITDLFSGELDSITWSSGREGTFDEPNVRMVRDKS